MKIIYVNCGERDKYGSDLCNIEHNLSSSEIKAWKKPEYLHKVSDVYHNNYLMQCLKVIYADGNRSLIHKRELSPWYITESCSRWEASYILVTRCTILHFGNFAKAVWQHVSHLVSWYLHCAVLSDVYCEM